MISVVVPAFNNAETLPRALRSVLDQTTPPLEVIVVDDGSTDETRETVEPFLRRGEARYFRQENRGVSASRNRGAQEARGRLVAFVDADDWLRRDALALSRAALEETPGARWCVTDVVRLRGDREEVLATRLPEHDAADAILRENFVQRGFLFERALLRESGGYDPALQGREDWELFIRLFRAGHLPAHAAQPVYCYEERPGSLTRDYRKIGACWDAVVRKHHLKLAKEGDPALRRICAEQLWALGRFYRRRAGLPSRALSCALLSLRCDPRPARLTQGLRYRWHRIRRTPRHSESA